MSGSEIAPITTAANEGLNLPPRVAEGGERAMLSQLIELFNGYSKAAIGRARESASVENRWHCEGRAYAYGIVAGHLSQLLENE